MSKKEHTIGDVIEVCGRNYLVCEGNNCGICDLSNNCDEVRCTDFERRDGQNVYFKEVDDGQI